MERAYKFRLYPTTEQQKRIVRTIGCSRFLYNYCLNERITASILPASFAPTAVHNGPEQKICPSVNGSVHPAAHCWTETSMRQ